MVDWKQASEAQAEEPIWLKEGTLIIIDHSFEPEQREIPSDFGGNRKVWVLNTIDNGLIYVSPKKFRKICDALEKVDYQEDITVII